MNLKEKILRIALYSKNVKLEHRDFIISSIVELLTDEHQLILNDVLFDNISNTLIDNFFLTKSELIEFNPDLVLSLGGDGTILDTVLLTYDTQIPVLGVNLGRLGFLANIQKNELIQTIQKVKEGKSKIEKRNLLEVNSSIPIFINENYALNDFTILRANSLSMIEIKVFINGEFLNSYFADGLIVSTSTGSTGYSLSCGGPILYPNSNNFVITPIAPHNLNIRPIVVPDDVLLSFEVNGRTPEFLCTLDSRISYITSQHSISLKKSKHKFSLYNPNENSFIDALRYKLNLGKQ